MIKLSLCMIVKNEENSISNCLESVCGVMDEIIVVDTGSTDRTKDIAASFGAKVYDFEWIDDFAAARNYSFSLATCDYIMWLDADDIIKYDDKVNLLELKRTLPVGTVQVAAKYNVAFDENDIPTFCYYRERIFLRSADYKWIGAVHETIAIDKNCIFADFSVTHRKVADNNTTRNLQIYENQIAKGIVLSPRDLYYYSRELYYNNQTDKAIECFNDFLQSDAWFEDKIGAHLLLSRCYIKNSQQQKALETLFCSFYHALPRAEICCEIAGIYFSLQNYDLAIYWYTCATSCKKTSNNLAFTYEDCHSFIPYLQLCVCYDKLKKHDIAEYYNNQAALIKPNNSSVLANIEYFKNKKSLAE